MRLVFAGTPAVAEPTLRTLAAAHDVAAVITREDAPLGRKRTLTPSPVASSAEALGLPVIRANRLDASVTQQVEGLEPDLGVIVAYGGFVREPLLHTPRLGWINLHFSLLPRWRGAAPVQRAIMAGDTETGASVFQLVAEMDAGEVFQSIVTPIGAHQTAGSLLAQLADEGAELVASVVSQLAAGTARSTPQGTGVTLAPKLTLDDARIDWNLPVETVYQRLRGVTPEPGAFTLIGGERFKVLEAEPVREAASLPPGHFRAGDGGSGSGSGSGPVVGTADLPLRLLRVQPAGKKPIAATDWWRGLPNRPANRDDEMVAE